MTSLSANAHLLCHRSWIHSGFALLFILFAFGVPTQVTAQDTAPLATASDRAPVIVDGRELFLLRGVSAFPAAERAKLVRNRIIAAAGDPSVSVDDLVVKEEDGYSSVYVGDQLLFRIVDEDAALENIDRKMLAGVITAKIAGAITQYRMDRSSTYLLTNTVYALGLTAAVFLLLWGVIRLFRFLDNWAVRHVQKGVEDLASKSHQLIKAGQAWSLFAGLIRGFRILVIVVVVYFYLNTLLGLYPWTRPFALILFELVLNPVESLWRGFVSSLPNLAFLVILTLIVRYLLKLTRTFFMGVARRRIKLKNFDSDWALPTYKIIRFVAVAFAIVVAYPYIPGSDSAAFKGVSLFLGVIFSLGSSSFIANMVAGMAMTYRGAFKEGDLIQVGDVMGTVTESKMMVTRVNTVKNESVVIPNSNILNTNVVNYSVLARKEGLIIHTVVGIGYDAPWRQVEAMLLMAAERTPGLLKEPKPFVLQLSMGDFAVNYQINVFCKDVSRLLVIKTDLHRNIQDVFNEHGVQIMSPAYRADPETPKIVPPERWYEAPATKPET